jgi:hypothetical protein
MIKMVVNPNALIFRESMQNRVNEVATRFINGDYPAIVVVNNLIIDGHNRAAVAINRGHGLTVVNLTQAEYDYLVNLGYDDMEISYAALTAADEIDAAMAYIDQFAGSNIFERGEEAYNNFCKMQR